MITQTSEELQHRGERAIAALIDQLYDRMLVDEELKHYFDEVDVQLLKQRQATYLTEYLTGQEKHYQGNTLRHTHQGLHITFEHYERLIFHINSLMREHQVSLDNRVKVESFLRSVKPHITGK